MPAQDEPTEPNRPTDAGPPDAQHSPAAPPKLRIPPTLPAPLHRGRLLTLLDDEENPAGPRPVTVVSGPAGSGKTTLLATWAAHVHEQSATVGGKPRIVWITLDATDNDPARLWPIVQEALPLGGATPDSPMDFITEIGAVSTPVCVILDEADHLQDEEALRGLETFVRQTPDNLRLVLAARTPPNLHLSRLRLEGRLLEIGLPDLAFTRAEAELLFRSHEVRLSPEEIDEVLQRTEGWAAGLRLAAMSLAGETGLTGQPGGLTAFPADDRAMADYLAEEVLGAHPPEVQQFLRAISVCESVGAELATALTGRRDSGEILDRLDRTNSLVSRTYEPGGWYRCHPVLRTVLQADLDRRQPFMRRTLNQIAAEWFRDSGQPLTAMSHAITAGHDSLVDELVETFGLREILTGHAAQLHRLLADLPTGGPARPATSLIAAAAALDIGDVPAADHHLSTVDDTGHQPLSGRLRTLQATVMLHRAQLDAQATTALDALPATADRTGEDDLDTLTLLTRGTALLGRGDHTKAEQELQRAMKLAGQGNREHALLQCHVQLAAVAGARGELSQMDEQAERAIEYAADRGWARTPHCLAAYTMRCAHADLQLDRAATRQFSALARDLLSPSAQPSAVAAALVLDTIVAFDEATPADSTTEKLRTRWRYLGKAQLSPHLIAYLAPATLQIALWTGQLDWAADIAEQVSARLGPTAEHAFLQAALHAYRSKPGQAHRFLTPVLNGDTPALAVTTAIDAWLLEASLLSRADDHHRAHGAIAKALALAKPLFAVRPFHTAGPPIRDLLVKGTGRFGKLDRFVSATIAALPAPRNALVDQLTSREHDLLIELPSMRTTEEIADSLFVSVNTVKTHLRGIYRKLGVSHRRDAVAVARERGLL